MIQDFPQILLGAFILLCALPFIIVLVVAFFAFRYGRKPLDDLLNPDTERLHKQLAEMRAAQPNAPTEQLIGRIIQRQALRSGLIGAITGLGGFFTLPIALPIDVLLSLRLQAALVNFIAHTYGHTNDDVEAQLRNQLIMAGGSRVTQSATGAVTGFLVRVIGKSFSKLVPFLGAALSFGVNYAFTQGVGRVTQRVYASRKLPTPAAR